jgi:mono/diheme cytochrome c family protein
MTRSLLFTLALGTLSLAACYEPPPFTEPQVLGGEEIDAATLTRGRKTYSMYCAPCHGMAGDGRGPSSKGLFPPPRDFRIATYKFAGTVPGKLPHDEDLIDLIESGLHGTGMIAWRLPGSMVHDVVQYIKTFSPEGKGWRHPRKKKAKRVIAGDDPWIGDLKGAVELGQALYHGMANCHSCHPAYESPDELNKHRIMFELSPLKEFRSNLYYSVVKESGIYSVASKDDKPCESAAECSTTQKCTLGRCEDKLRIAPPDFLVNRVRSTTTPAGLYRVVALGIPGTAMPTWQDALKPKELWATAHYVHDLMQKRGTPAGTALRASLLKHSGESAPK